MSDAMLEQIIQRLDEISAELRRQQSIAIGRRRRWTEEERQVVREMYPTTPAWMIAWVIQRGSSSVYQMAKSLGVEKDPDWHLNPLSGCNRPGHAIHGKESRFPKGHRPWNKGKKGWKAGGRSPETRFKPGQPPPTTLPVGSYRITYGILQRKIGTAPGPNHKRWRSVHELVWIEHNGPVPEGHICVFKPGQHTTDPDNITIDRIECITRAENMRRNTYHRYGPEIARAIQLKGALSRKINRRMKQREERNRRSA